jgi:hypothetical protein
MASSPAHSPAAGQTPGWARELAAVDTAPLFRPLLQELTGRLRALSAADWERPTLAGAWKVRDVAAHLIDCDLRKIAVYRDKYRLPMDAPIHSDQDLARFVNGLNAGGVAFGARLSPRLIIDLLEIAGEWVAKLIEGLSPEALSLFAVSWAGESESLNWMDTGREYTERWHHQMQIRDAVGEPRLLVPRWMEPMLDLSVRALPVAYANRAAPQGTVVTLEVHGPTSGNWSVVREKTRWRVVRGRPEAPEALVRMGTDDVWRVFYNAAASPGLRTRIQIEGDTLVAEPMLKARSVIL